MEICHAHNLSREPAVSKRFGIRVSLPRGDSFSRLLGVDWERYHWYSSAEERDEALREMRRYDCDPEDNGRLLTYINGNMEELARQLVELKVINEMPAEIPQLHR